MKNILTKVQTTFRALQLLSEPKIMEKLSAEFELKKSQMNDELNGKFIYHKHFIVQVMN